MVKLLLFFGFGMCLLVSYKLGQESERQRQGTELTELRSRVERYEDPLAWKSAEKVSRLTGVSFYQAMTGLCL